MELVDTSRGELVDYLTRQLEHFFPDRRGEVRAGIARDIDDALERTARCVEAARLWPRGRFDYLHSEQNTVFLYFLANTIHRKDGDRRLATKVFYLNKALNGFSCFYDTELPDVWFVGHSPGIVLARASYGSHLVLYQNSTVGKNHGAGPVLGEGVVLYPNAAIIGDCQIGDRTVVGQGQRVIDHSTPGDCYVFSEGAGLTFKTPKRDVLGDLFRF